MAVIVLGVSVAGLSVLVHMHTPLLVDFIMEKENPCDHSGRQDTLSTIVLKLSRTSDLHSPLLFMPHIFIHSSQYSDCSHA